MSLCCLTCAVLRQLPYLFGFGPWQQAEQATLIEGETHTYGTQGEAEQASVTKGSAPTTINFSTGGDDSFVSIETARLVIKSNLEGNNPFSDFNVSIKTGGKLNSVQLVRHGGRLHLVGLEDAEQRREYVEEMTAAFRHYMQHLSLHRKGQATEILHGTGTQADKKPTSSAIEIHWVEGSSAEGKDIVADQGPSPDAGGGESGGKTAGASSKLEYMYLPLV